MQLFLIKLGIGLDIDWDNRVKCFAEKIEFHLKSNCFNILFQLIISICFLFFINQFIIQDLTVDFIKIKYFILLYFVCFTENIFTISSEIILILSMLVNSLFL